MIDRYDVIALVGLGVFSAALWMIWQPLGLAAVGMGLMALGVLGAAQKRAK